MLQNKPFARPRKHSAEPQKTYPEQDQTKRKGKSHPRIIAYGTTPLQKVPDRADKRYCPDGDRSRKPDRHEDFGKAPDGEMALDPGSRGLRLEPAVEKSCEVIPITDSLSQAERIDANFSNHRTAALKT